MNHISANLKRIRLLKNLSLKEAGSLLNMSATAISKYENGLIQPDSKKLIEFSNAYNVKTSTLLKSYNSPIMNFSSFRKKKRLTGQNLTLLKETIQNEVSKYLKVIELNNLENPPINLKKYNCTTINDIENIANEFRLFIQISNKQPISDLTNILENLGIIIIQIKNQNNNFNGFDGLSELVNNIPVIILLDDINDGARQRFTIAHELGHLILNTNNKELDIEVLCNRFASALLMPKEAIINEFGINRKNISLFELKAFKEEYKVSYTAIIYRLKELNIISEYLFKKLSITLSQNKSKQSFTSIPKETSYQFQKLVHKLETDEIISLNKACELLGVSIDEYNQENNNY